MNYTKPRIEIINSQSDEFCLEGSTSITTDLPTSSDDNGLSGNHGIGQDNLDD